MMIRCGHQHRQNKVLDYAITTQDKSSLVELSCHACWRNKSTGITANAKRGAFTAPEALELCLFHIVGRDHPPFSGFFHGSGDPAFINHFTVDNSVVLTESDLIVILGIVVIQGNVHQTLNIQKTDTEWELNNYACIQDCSVIYECLQLDLQAAGYCVRELECQGYQVNWNRACILIAF